ncbi:ethanolaminephosphotransferase 1-like [Leptidea sinapis]|uniref:ethanolaminephosphotransferase 1-like n=1 Tax=Leptidea sinapis TaxID=189913 RepID=UPI00212D1081|nr:ethanolaminephosphotransferase 1-like [Leptidea sinapis]
MFEYKYLSESHLKGFRSYKYSAIDTSPLSKYVMHPVWNNAVKIIPKWIAPNLLTFAGFICMLVDVMLLMVLDYDCTASANGSPAQIPREVFLLCGILLFLAYNLDGIDGKQARRLGVTGPLGEMFDHGLDSYIVFLIPFCLFSVFGRDEYSIPMFRGYLIVVSVVLNFYVSHWEKYNTGTLYLPWGYDLSMWAASGMFLVAGWYGPTVYKTYIFGSVTFVQGLEVAIHATGLFTTLPVAVYNVHLSYKNKTGKMYPLIEALRPIWPMLIMTGAMTSWASFFDIIEKDLRAFLLLFGTLFSNISSRLIVAEMSDSRCDTICWINIPILGAVGTAVYLPQYELTVLYTMTIAAICAHVHYGVCVVRQMCEYFKIQCFVVPKEKRK